MNVVEDFILGSLVTSLVLSCRPAFYFLLSFLTSGNKSLESLNLFHEKKFWTMELQFSVSGIKDSKPCLNSLQTYPGYLTMKSKVMLKPSTLNKCKNSSQG